MTNKIKTPQSLVHIKHTVTLRQFKYWYLMIREYSEILKNNNLSEIEDGFIYFSKSKLTKLLGYEPVNEELKQDFEALRKEPITVNFLEKDGSPAVHGMGFISEWKISSKRAGFKLPSFVQNIIQYNLKEISMFLVLDWEVFHSLKSKYEAVIYKFCKDYQGATNTRYITIEEYRECIGIKDTEYKQFFELNRRTIQQPIKSINKNPKVDILIDVHFRRKGRKVIGLYFSMTPKKKLLPKPKEKPQSTAFSLAKVSISSADQKKYLETMEEAEIIATIERANEYAESLTKQDKKANLGAIYKKAFTDRWGIQYLESKSIKDKELEEKKAKQLQIKQIEKAEQEKIQKEQEANTKAIEKFNALSEIEQEKVLDKIETNLKETPFFAKDFKKKRSEGKEFICLPPYVFELKKFL